MKNIYKQDNKIDPLNDGKNYYEKLGISPVNSADFYEVKSNFYKNFSFY